MEPPRLDCLLGCFGWEPARMGRADEALTKIWMALIKLGLIIPTGIGAFGTRSIYLFIKSHEELKQSPPFHPKVEISLLLVYVGLVTIFAWIFFSMLLIRRARGSYILFIGLVDLALAITLAVGVSIQAEYLPSDKGGCSDSKADDWQVVGDNKSFFKVASELGLRLDASSSCKAFVGQWQTAAACLFCQMLVSYIGVFYDVRETSVLNPFRPAWLFILTIVTPFVVTKHQILPRMRFAVIALKNTIRRVRSHPDVELAKHEPYVPQYQHMISIPMLQQVLHIEHVLLKIVENMCYEDVINFSLTSRAIREAVYPARDLAHRIPKLRRDCCDFYSKSRCMYCNKGICRDCKVEKLLPGMPGRRHVESCTPHCRTCYYTHFSRHPPGYYKNCKCTSTDRAIKLNEMCRTCSERDLEQLQAERHRRYQKEALDIAFGVNGCAVDGKKCGKCIKDLKAGMRWWVCGRCHGECRHPIHPSHVAKKKDVDVEKALAEGGGIIPATYKGWRALLRLKDH